MINVGVFQSSGLDSNAILFFASKELEFKKRKIFTYTAINFYLDKINPKYHSRISDDDLLKQSLHLYNNVNPVFLDFCDVDFSKEFKKSEYDFDNPIVTKSKFWLRGILQKAKKDKMQLMFTGQLGNFTITWNAPYILFSELLRFRVRYVLKSIRVIKSVKNWTYFQILKLYILNPLKQQLKIRVKIISGKMQNNLEESSIFKAPLKQLINWKKELKSSTNIYRISFYSISEKLRKRLLLINANVTGIRWYNEGFSNVLLTSDPTIDSRLVNFLLKTPEIYFNKYGSSKYLFRLMMKDKLYEPLLNNNITIEQSFDLPHRILNDSFFNNFLSEVGNQTNYLQVFKFNSLISDFEYLKSKNSDVSKYLVAIKFLKNISVLYLYDYYAKRNYWSKNE